MRTLIGVLIAAVMIVIGWVIIEIEPAIAMALVIGGAMLVAYGVNFDKLVDWMLK